MSTHNRHCDTRTPLQRDDDAFWTIPPDPEESCTLGYAEDVEEAISDSTHNNTKP